MARGGLRINVSTNIRPFVRGMNEAQGTIDKFAKGAGHLSRLGGGGLAGVVGGLTSFGGAAAFVKEATSATTDLYKSTKRLSTVTGMDMKQSNAWIDLAKSRGIQTDALVRSYTSLSKQIGQAQGGSKKAIDTFNQLGVSQAMLRSGDTAAIMGKIADSFSKHADGLGKSKVASQLFGRSYAPVLALLNKGSKTLKELLKDELKHGAVLTRSQKEYERSIRAQRAFNQSMEKLKVTVGNAVLPYITKLTEKLTGWLQKGANQKKIEQMVHAFWKMASNIAGVVKVVAPLVKRVGDFVGKNPKLVQMVGYMVALRGAVKLISFANPISGVMGLVNSMRVASKVASKYGSLAGAKFAGGFMLALIPAFESVQDLLSGQKSRQTNAIGRTFAMVGGGLLGSLLGPAGALAGAGVAGMGYSALFPGQSAPNRKSVQGYVKRNGRYVLSPGAGVLRKQPKGLVWMTQAEAAARNATQDITDIKMPAMPNFGVEPTVPTQSTAAKPKRKKASGVKVTPEEALHAAFKLRHWAHPYSVRLARISVNDHTLAANRRRKSILSEGISKWKGVRSEMKTLANDAHKGGDAEIFGQIWDLIHDGDAKVAKWKQKLAAVNDTIAIASSQEAIDNANRRLSIAQNTIKSEESFLRAAFGFGDIGTGGTNAFLAAGGAPTNGNQVAGGNVNITINTLHPGDSKTKAAIGAIVTNSFTSQGSRKVSRTVMGV